MRAIMKGDPRLLTGLIKYAIVHHGNQYVAWTRTWEGPARPDWAAAWADLSEWRRKNQGDQNGNDR